MLMHLVGSQCIHYHRVLLRLNDVHFNMQVNGILNSGALQYHFINNHVCFEIDEMKCLHKFMNRN